MYDNVDDLVEAPSTAPNAYAVGRLEVLEAALEAPIDRVTNASSNSTVFHFRCIYFVHLRPIACVSRNDHASLVELVEEPEADERHDVVSE